MLKNNIRIDRDLLSEIIYQKILTLTNLSSHLDYIDAITCTDYIMEELEEYKTNKVTNR